MANRDEEDYLESLLKSMSSDSKDENSITSEDAVENFNTFSFQNNEDDNTDNNILEVNNVEDDFDDQDSKLLSQMILNDSAEIPEEVYSENVDEKTEDMDELVTDLDTQKSESYSDESSAEGVESDFDGIPEELLNSLSDGNNSDISDTLLEENNDVPMESVPENASDINLDELLGNISEDVFETSKENSDDIEETSIEDMLKALQNNTFDEEPEISEDNKESEQNSGVENDVAIDDSIADELADILALDDGMSIEDIPDEIQEDSALTDEENQLINNIVENTESDNTPDYGNKKKKKNKKDKKNKKKFNLKSFFSKFDDSEEPSSGNVSADENQQIIDEVYGTTDSLADEEVKPEKTKKKKEKKEKKPKEKKVKPAKEKKVKEPKPVQPQQKVAMGSLIKAIIFVAIICAGIIVSSKFVTYNNDLKSAKELYSKGSYTAAYEIIQGMNIKSKDQVFYMRSRTMASLYQGMESYDAYMEIGDSTSAIAALVKTVSRKYILDEQIIKYEIEIPAETLYARVLSVLDKHGISEQKALDLNAITNYEEFINKISSYGGLTDDSNN